MIHKYFSLVLLLFFNNISYSQETIVTGEFELIFKNEPVYNLFTLKKPNRLVLDIHKQNLIKITEKKNINSNYSFRKNNNHNNNVRIVFDIKDSIINFDKKITKTNNDFKLVIYFKNNITNESSYKNFEQNIFSHIDNDFIQEFDNNKQYNKKNTKKYLVVIDPGHGGNDSGAIGKTYKTFEKKITLDYSKSLKFKLEQLGKYKVILTRNSDKYLTLAARRNIAKKYKADIFISIHADSSPRASARGASVYTLSEKAYDKESRILSEKENMSDMIQDVDLSNEKKDIAHMLLDLVRRDTSNISSNLAQIITKELGKKIKLIKNEHRFAGFRVLKGIDIPGVLIELGYLSNKEDEKLLNSYAHKEKTVTALTQAIDLYCNQY